MRSGEIAALAIAIEGEHVVASIKGEVDPSNARQLGSEVTAAVPNDAMGVVLDLSAVDYLDSSGVQLIFELAERLGSRQQELALVVPPGSPSRRVLEIVALDQTALMTDSRSEALSRLPRAV